MPSVLQSSAALGRENIPTSGEAADVIFKKSTYKFAVDATSGDIVELAILPARHYIVDMRYMETGAVTEGNIGVMAGTVGDTTFANRSIATNLITSQKAIDAAFAVTPVEYDRSIGVVVTAATAASTVTLVLQYAQG
ncbi:hypothetical protein V5F77_04360 [Xanthobacter sp. DSM 24535]|uniref:hypothetical protein n=1 Tax=Roseixanthobacter psychrophilus TaxID=3119917 RepID=UPI0037284783